MRFAVVGTGSILYPVSAILAEPLCMCYSSREEKLRERKRKALKVKYGGRSPKFIWAPCHVIAQLFPLAETEPRNRPLPRNWAHKTRSAIGQLRQTTSRNPLVRLDSRVNLQCQQRESRFSSLILVL
jgi:hypothetical protein